MQQNQITDQEMRILLKSQQGEMDGMAMYKALAEAVKDPEDADTFKQLAAEEGHHAAVFRKYTRKIVKPKRFKGSLLVCLYRILGRKRLYPLIAQGEYRAYKTYLPVIKRFPEVESVRQDEKRHGDIVKGLLD